MSDRVLVLDEVVFRYGENGPFVFEQLSLNVKHGEFVAILGPNGTGKSTLARLIHGMLEPTRGEILFEGRPIRDHATKEYLHHRVGLVFQNPDSQMVATSVADEIAFGPCNLQWDRERVQQGVKEAMERFRLTALAERPLHQLSGGEKRRVTLASVWITKPSLWILDEPVAMLDTTARRATKELLNELHQDGETIIYLGHRLDEVLEADRVLVLHAGRVAWEGPPQRLASSIQEVWGIARPPAYNLWTEICPSITHDKEILTVEELVEALWESSSKTSR